MKEVGSESGVQMRPAIAMPFSAKFVNRHLPVDLST